MHAEFLQYGELLDCHLWKVMRLCQVVQGSERRDSLTNLLGDKGHSSPPEMCVGLAPPIQI